MYKRILQVFTVFLLMAALFSTSTVFAQTSLRPQKVTAVIEGEFPAGMWDPACPPAPVKFTVEVWNVGSKGGADYAPATVTYEGKHCSVNNGSASLVKNDPETYQGTFTGGPDGEFSFNDPDLASWKIDFVNGTSAQVIIFFGDKSYVFEGQVQNPEAFYEETPTQTEITPSPTPAGACSPVIGNLDGLKPGDTLSPDVQYYDPDGKNVGALSSVLYFNGQQANSIIWNGSETTIILQYTCPDHSAHQTQVVVPAYAGGGSANPPDSQNQPNPPAASNPNSGGSGNSGDGLMKTLGTVGGIITGLVGAAGAAASGGYVAAKVTAKTASGAVKSTVQPAKPVIESIPTPPELQKPIYKKLTPDERIHLEKRKKMMETQINDDGAHYNAYVAARQKLLYIYKQNGFKYVMKIGLEQATKITFGAEEWLADKTLDPVLERIFQKDDIGNDALIMREMHSALDELDAQADEMMQDINHLMDEIKNIDLQLKNG